MDLGQCKGVTVEKDILGECNTFTVDGVCSVARFQLIGVCMRNPVDSHNTIMSLYNSIMMRS